MLPLLAGLSLCAAPATVVLDHQSDASCPDAAWLEGNVTARLGYSPFVASAPLTAHTKAQCSSRACTATLVLVQAGQPRRERTLDAAAGQCRDLMESLGLALALALDPQLLTREPPPAQSSEPAPAPPPPPQKPPPVILVQAPPPEPEPAPPPPSEPLKFQGAVTGHGALGLSPYPTGGAAVGAGLRYGWFGLLAEGRFDAPRSAPVIGGQVTSSVLLGSLFACGHLKGVGLCVSGSGGALQVAGALPGGRLDTSPVVLVGGRVQYEWMFLDWLGVRAHVDVSGVITRTTVRTTEVPVVWRTSQVAGDAGLGLVVLFEKTKTPAAIRGERWVSISGPSTRRRPTGCSRS